MAFEQELRDKINGFPHGSADRNLLKVVLGDWQQKAASGKVTDEIGHAVVKKIIVGNTENLGYLPEGDPRRATLLHENEVLATLLPSYWSGDQISQCLVEGGVDLHSGNEGQATGRAMKFLKEQNALVEGGTVKDVVIGLRKS